MRRVGPARWAALLVALAASLAGCGGDGGGGPGALRFWHFYGPPDSATGGPLVKLIEKYERAHPGVTVEVRHIPFGEFNRTLLQAAAGRELPDVALIGATATQAMAEAGVISDLTPRVAAWGKQAGFLPASWNTTQVGGKTYGLPHVADSYAIYYNTDIFRRARTEPPKTWAELGETARKLARDGRQGLAISGIEGEEGATALVIRLLVAGGDPAKVDTPQGRAALSHVKAMVDRGAVSKGMLGWNEEDVKNQFANGRAAMMINSATYVSTLRTENPDLKWDVALLPGDARRTTFLAAENLTITSGSARPDAAWDLLTWMQRPDVLAGYLPARNKLPARTDVPDDGDEIRAVFREQLRSAWAPTGALARNSTEVFTHIQGALQAAVSGSVPVERALADAQRKIDEALTR
ncbi:ABC transporter substrate-binding protein [Spongiactinospora sp. 9N601]|uniref:ABC transporter substrate-binding protein n=1 Tax=Spongiactinospora sp. 9N601 TaxID=3375149 RepID=UPI00379140FE